MSIIDINGQKVHIEDGSESVEHAVHYLRESPGNAEALFNEAHKTYGNPNRDSHFEIPHTPENRTGTHHFTLISNGDGTFNLRKKSHHLI